MHRLQLHYALTHDAGPALVRNPLIELLQAISQQGSISAGARALGLSYRHVWGELKRWEAALGQELLIWEKGQKARLSPFGAKLMWAERQAQARLAPQIEALRAELERSFAQAFDDQVQVLTLYASHDSALTALREWALRPAPAPSKGSAVHPQTATDRNPALHVDVRFTGSVDAIRALNEGRCELAGFHTLESAGRKTRSERTYKPLLQPGLHKIMGFARRTQGLMVAPGNPLALGNLGDAVRCRARFAMRSLGSGTRVLLEELLDQAQLSALDLCCAARCEPSHMAVAQAVASGQCDVGLGLADAAFQAGLDFVPLVQERYHLVCLKSALDQAPVKALRHLLQTPSWQERIAQIQGYVPAQSGEVLSLRQVLPWWSFRPKEKNSPD